MSIPDASLTTENVLALSLREFMASPLGWGSHQGQKVREHLQAEIQMHPTAHIVQISLAGVERLDAIFARESFVELACAHCGQQGYYLVDITDQDILENCDGGAFMRKQPLLFWDTVGSSHILGPQPSVGLRGMLLYVLSNRVAGTSEAAAALSIQVPNAGNKLMQLWREGYVLRRERDAHRGSREYEYLRIGGREREQEDRSL